jgi:hypothetical protein
MNISDKALAVISKNMDVHEMDFNELEISLSVVISAPILGQDDDKQVQLEFDMFYDMDDIHNDIERALERGEYDGLRLIWSDYTDKELEAIALLKKLAA